MQRRIDAARDRRAKRQKNLDHFSICACHPCAGAMLIFSVSFQFYRMSPKRQRRCNALQYKVDSATLRGRGGTNPLVVLLPACVPQPWKGRLGRPCPLRPVSVARFEGPLNVAARGLVVRFSARAVVVTRPIRRRYKEFQPSYCTVRIIKLCVPEPAALLAF
jgi:hypothetical protein